MPNNNTGSLRWLSTNEKLTISQEISYGMRYVTLTYKYDVAERMICRVKKYSCLSDKSGRGFT